MPPTRLDVALVQTLLVSCIGALFYYMLEALGSRALAGLMRVAVVMVIIAVFVPALWHTLLDVKASIEEAAAWVERQIDKLTFWRRDTPTPQTIQENVRQQVEKWTEERGRR